VYIEEFFMQKLFIKCLFISFFTSNALVQATGKCMETEQHLMRMHIFGSNLRALRFNDAYKMLDESFFPTGPSLISCLDRWSKIKGGGGYVAASLLNKIFTLTEDKNDIWTIISHVGNLQRTNNIRLDFLAFIGADDFEHSFKIGVRGEFTERYFGPRRFPDMSAQKKEMLRKVGAPLE
jgi:hypothetical protein